mmetsp:Transcript_13485/g.40797  ORF Transcript_13485/g.40797 Transcript_13485/m.40797 type:complete len:290 (-) Transcript_13485:2-871(-)
MKASCAAVAVLLLAGSAMAQAPAPAPAAAGNITDVDILNFALNLEYLEAEFYNCAVYGEGLNEEQRMGGPASTGCTQANLTGPTLAYATEIAKDELDHVLFLQTALADAAVAMPEINIGTSFEAAANAAFNMTLPVPFNPYANDLFFLHGAFIFEDVGVTAYKGAAALLTNKDLVTPAAGILAVEAYHAGLVRRMLYDQSNTTVEAYGVTVEQIVEAIATLRATVSMAADDQGVVMSSMANIVPADENSIAFSRTPAQVLSIVTLGSTNGTGGFFPMGLNGVIGAPMTA